mgnify:FL=1
MDGYIIKKQNSTAVFDTHLHDLYEINFALSCGTQIIIENQIYETKPGEVFLFPPYVFHQLDSRGMPYERWVLFFRKQTLLAEAPSLAPAIENLKVPRVLKLTAEQTNTFCRLLGEAEAESRKNDPLSLFRNICALGRILVFLAETGEETKLTSENVPQNEIGAVLAYISAHLAEPQGIDLLCRRFCMSRTKFCTLIRRSIGMSYQEYLLHLRLAKAMECLSGGMSVTDTAEQSGFPSYANFIRTFKKHVGVTPYQYGKKGKFSEKIDK